MKYIFIDGVEIKPGTRQRINLDMGRIYDFTEIDIPVEIIRGKKDGPTLFISSTIHGDEINGIEIVRRLLNHKSLKDINGTLIAIPIVNVFGFNDRSRYLPDRRDLNRCFPGIKNGSLASQLAYKFTNEIIKISDYGIDIHTGAFHRKNLSQIRANLEDERTMELAYSFGAPVMIDSNLRDGSLRESVAEMGIPILLYEGGEALRFDENVIETGVDGILATMQAIGMIKKAPKTTNHKTYIAKSSQWVRAHKSGLNLVRKELGDIVKKGELLGEITSPFGENMSAVKSPVDGIIIGISQLPLANKGDALFHIATKRIHKKPKGENFDNVEYVDPISYQK